MVRKGLSLGVKVQILDGFFIDPSHCFLISIGDHSVLAPNVRLIAHDASMFRHIGITKIGRVRIERNCFLGDSTIVLPGVTVGQNSIIGAGSVVVKDIPANSVAAGNPAKVIGTSEDFLKRHQQNKLKRRVFDEKYYNINWITEERKIEMVNLLNEQFAYMEGEIPEE